MDKLFTLSAELTLEAANFLQALRQAEQSARSAGDELRKYVQDLHRDRG